MSPLAQRLGLAAFAVVCALAAGHALRSHLGIEMTVEAVRTFVEQLGPTAPIVFIFVVMLNAKASEQSARMVSMKNATDSAEGLTKDLTRDYNNLRQGNITKELLEIAGGQAE